MPGLYTWDLSYPGLWFDLSSVGLDWCYDCIVSHSAFLTSSVSWYSELFWLSPVTVSDWICLTKLWWTMMCLGTTQCPASNTALDSDYRNGPDPLIGKKRILVTRWPTSRKLRPPSPWLLFSSMWTRRCLPCPSQGNEKPQVIWHVDGHLSYQLRYDHQPHGRPSLQGSLGHGNLSDHSL